MLGPYLLGGVGSGRAPGGGETDPGMKLTGQLYMWVEVIARLAIPAIRRK